MPRVHLGRSSIPRSRTTWCADCRRGRCGRRASTQNSVTSSSACHSAAPVLALEVERIDVLVLLRRVLGVLDRAVGAMAEPLGMLAHPGVIGRALPGEIERDLHARAARASRLNASKSSSVPSAGSIAVCPPAGEPIAQGLPGSSGPAAERVVASLPEAGADRMNRREVDHVEAEVGDARQLGARLAERAAPVARRDRRSAETSRTTRRSVPARDRPRRDAARTPWRASDRRSVAMTAASSPPSATSTRSAGGVESFDRLAPARAARRGRYRWPAPPASRMSQGDPSTSSSDDVLAGRGLDLQIAPPGEEAIDPGDDLILVPPDRVDDEARGPVVGAGRVERHRRFPPPVTTIERRDRGDRRGRTSIVLSACSAISAFPWAVAQHGRDDVVAVGEDAWRVDLDRFAGRALDGEASAIDLGTHGARRRRGARARPGCLARSGLRLVTGDCRLATDMAATTAQRR